MCRELRGLVRTALGEYAEALTSAVTDNGIGRFVLPSSVGAVLAMSTGLREGFTPEQPRTVASTTETTLAAWAQDELVGA